MPNVYVEARPKGRPEGSAIEGFVVEDHANHVLATFKTQRRPSTGRQSRVTRLIARARHLNDKKKSDHWHAD
jgi:hypothetical protein